MGEQGNGREKKISHTEAQRTQRLRIEFFKKSASKFFSVCSVSSSERWRTGVIIKEGSSHAEIAEGAEKGEIFKRALIFSL
jgi:hypothetical protein